MIELKSSSPELDEIVMRIGMAVMRWQDATQAYDEAVGERLGLNLAERRCLSFLYGGSQSAGAIAQATSLTPAAVTALIDRLEARGLVARTRSAEDRRKVMVEVTEEAKRATDRYYQPIAEEGGRFLATFALQELQAMERFLQGAIAMQERHLAAITAEEAAGA
jgi:DNA-binding MarR family transcriptional regulator